MTARAALTLGLLLTLGGRLEAQSSVGVASTQPPEEDAYVYKQVPDVQIVRTGVDATRLSALWQDKPVLLAMVFSRCVGSCSPFLRSLKSAVSDAGGAGSAYRVVVLSFDSADTAADVDAMATNTGIAPNTGWVFGVAPQPDIRRLAEATGFWFRWDQTTEQYDHPSMVVAIDRGRVASNAGESDRLGNAPARSPFKSSVESSSLPMCCRENWPFAVSSTTRVPAAIPSTWASCCSSSLEDSP